MVRSRAWAFAALSLIGSMGCKPDEEGRASLLTEPRVLAVQATPAEAEPGATVAFDILRAGPEGRLEFDGLGLDFCIQRKPIAAPGMLAKDCTEAGPNAALLPVAMAQPPRASIPEDACATFGPSPPAPAPNEPPLRAVDPDTTGGYYQPLRAMDGESASVGFVRLVCGLAGTTQENSAEYKRRSRANENPLVESVLVAHADGLASVSDEASPIDVAPLEHVLLAATWQGCAADQKLCGDGICSLDESTAACPEDCTNTPQCHGAETYLLLDRGNNQLRLVRETIRVSWYVTGGTLDRDRSGRAADELERDAQNGWTAPAEPGNYWLIVVIRDDRGGVGWTLRSLRVGA